jgi:WD40 repeat protein
MENGLGFWDLETGKLLTAEAEPGILRVLFEPSGALLTCGATGTFRWPVRMVESRLLVGPREPVAQLPPACDLAIDRDGRTLAASAKKAKPFAQHAGVRVLLTDKAQPPRIFDRDLSTENIALSADGRWLSWGLEGKDQLKIVDLKEAAAAKEFSGHGNVPCFSGDGKWLAIAGEHGCLFRIGTWEPGVTFSGIAAFSNDSKTLAVETGAGEIRLLNLTTGKEFGRLVDPNLAVASKLLFTPDDSLLLTLNDGAQPGIRVWDLRLVRERLGAAGLDWAVPPFLKSKGAKGEPLPRVDIDLGK